MASPASPAPGTITRWRWGLATSGIRWVNQGRRGGEGRPEVPECCYWLCAYCTAPAPASSSTAVAIPIGCPLGCAPHPLLQGTVQGPEGKLLPGPWKRWGREGQRTSRAHIVVKSGCTCSCHCCTPVSC